MRDIFSITILTLKYWFQGQGLKEAHEYAKIIVGGFKK